MSRLGAFTSTTSDVDAGIAADKAAAAIAELGPMPERAVIGFIVSQATWDTLGKRFPPGSKRKRGDKFGAVPIVVDPEAPANQCMAVYSAAEWAERISAIAKRSEP